MKRFIGPILLGLLFLLLFGWAVGSFAHWFYYNAMVVMSKMVLGGMYGILVLAMILLLAFVLRKKDDQR